MISRNEVDRIGASASNFTCSLYRILLAGWLVVGSFSAGELFAETPLGKVIRWDNQIEDGTAYALAPTRGETMILQPRFLQYGVPMDLTQAYTVYMIYKAVGDTNVYSLSGSILNATNGQAQIEWSSSNELAATTYAYDILVSDATRTVVGARGAIKFRDGVATGATLTDLQPINILDFDQVVLLNVGNAPFLSSYEIADVREYLTAIQTGLGDIDAKDVTVRGTLNYTNWPGYLARTNQIPMGTAVEAGTNITVAISTNAGRIVYTVTSTASGGGGGGGIGSYTNTMINGVTHSNSVAIADGDNIAWILGTDAVWRASASIQAIAQAGGLTNNHASTVTLASNLVMNGNIEIVTEATGSAKQIRVTGGNDLNILSAGNLNFSANSFTPLRLFKGNLALTTAGQNFNIGAQDDADIGFFADRTGATTWRAKGSGAVNPTLIRSNLGSLKFYTDYGATANATYTPTERMSISSNGIVTISSNLTVGGTITAGGNSLSGGYIASPANLLPFVANGTATFTSAMLSSNAYWYITPTNATVFTTDASLTNSAVVTTLSLDLFYNAQTFSFQAGTMTNTVVITSNQFNSIIFHKGFGSTILTGK